VWEINKETAMPKRMGTKGARATADVHTIAMQLMLAHATANPGYNAFSQGAIDQAYAFAKYAAQKNLRTIKPIE
jgi:hypothetical protein